MYSVTRIVKKLCLPSILCTVLAFSVYYNTLNAGFTYDDTRAIIKNPDILPETPWWSLWRNDFWGTPINTSNSHGSYRPLTVLTFRLNYWLSGMNPRSFHLTNTVLHSFCTLLVYQLATILLPGPCPLSGALLFAVHPVHCEAVASIVGRADILANIFFLFAFLLYIAHCKLRNGYGRSFFRHRKHIRQTIDDNFDNVYPCYNVVYPFGYVSHPFYSVAKYTNHLHWCYLFGSIIFATMAMLSKETGISVIAVCIVYDYLRTYKLHHKKWKMYRSMSLMAATMATLMYARMQMMGSSAPTFATSDNPTSKSPSLLTRTLTFLYLPVFNFLLLLHPHQLSFDWGMEAIPRITSVRDSRNLTSVIFYATLFLLFYVSFVGATPTVNNVSTRRRSPHYKLERQLVRLHSSTLIALCLMTLPFLPATNLFFYVGFVVAERVLYIPSLGFCFLVALGIGLLAHRTHSKHHTILLLILITLHSTRTFIRNQDWHSEEALYKSGIRINPPKAYANLGSILSSEGRIEEAEKALKLALAYRPNMADAYYNLGMLQQSKQEYEQAINSYKMAIQYRPSLALAYLKLGQLLASLNSSKEAEEVLQHCASLDGSQVKDSRTHEIARVTALRHLGSIKAQMGLYEEAVDIFKRAVNMMPNHYKPHTLFRLLADSLKLTGKSDEAAKWYKAAFKSQSNSSMGDDKTFYKNSKKHHASHLHLGCVLQEIGSSTGEGVSAGEGIVGMEMWERSGLKAAKLEEELKQYAVKYRIKFGLKYTLEKTKNQSY